MFLFKKFLHYCWGMIVSPASTIRQIASTSSLCDTFASMLLWGLGYSAFALLAYPSGGIPWTLWVAIPSLWETVYELPLFLSLWIPFHMYSMVTTGLTSTALH